MMLIEPCNQTRYYLALKRSFVVRKKLKSLVINIHTYQAIFNIKSSSGRRMRAYKLFILRMQFVMFTKNCILIFFDSFEIASVNYISFLHSMIFSLPMAFKTVTKQEPSSSTSLLIFWTISSSALICTSTSSSNSEI